MDLKNIEYVKAPEGPGHDFCRITPGAIYAILSDHDDTIPGGLASDLFKIHNDTGQVIYCLFSGCAHLNGMDWIACDRGGTPLDLNGRVASGASFAKLHAAGLRALRRLDRALAR